jgi:putative endonuclease
MKQPAVYLLASKPNGTLYIGVTSNLIARVWQHRGHVVDGFTRQYDITRLVWFEMHETMDSAIVREKRIKKWNREWKRNMIERSNPTWRDLWDDILPAHDAAAVVIPAHNAVIPAKAGIQVFAKELDSRLRGNDER